MKEVTQDLFTVVMANADNPEDILFLKNKLQVDEEILTYASDKNELSHLEYNKDEHSLLLIYNVLDVSKQGHYYQTVPITFYVHQNRLITIYKDRSAYIVNQMATFLKKTDGQSLYKFLFTMLYVISKNYFPTVEKMNHERNRLNLLLRERTSKRELLELSDLETGLVYMVSSSKQNVLLLQQVKSLGAHLKLTDIEAEELDDAIIEAKQLLEMTQLSAQVLNQLEGTYNNVLNNELNDTMKILTLLSILLTIPSIVTGFFGINVPLPRGLTHNPIGWVMVILISVVLWFVMALILRVIMKYRKK
ncbi:magnesium transporter CorA family protein [Streptococcus parauberis]|uniref:magnesium transporter CorA family protein n=1 Tax=Streptococcus parauberis TaxID=1348 RepID=UPI00288D783C|nr:magnesium transporter CorA family protein [Streptococcus parauberis]MDT2748292.1 magnesium transporter CorA family protein [Streptococcus parauberis]